MAAAYRCARCGREFGGSPFRATQVVNGCFACTFRHGSTIDRRPWSAFIVGVLGMAALFAAAILLAGCAGDEHGGGLAMGTPPELSSPTGSAAPASLLVHDVLVIPPTWMPEGDYDALLDGVSEYILDASSALGGWMPEAEDAGRVRPLAIKFDDGPGNYWAFQMRQASLSWPRGATSGRPVKERFAPLLAQVLVLDRRRELGLSGALTAQERLAVDRGLVLPVVLATNWPALYD